MRGNFRVDDNGPGRIRQLDQAVGPLAVRQHTLEFIRRIGERILDDGRQLDFPECASSLLVIKNVLKTDNLRGELRDVLLGLIDHGEPFGELGDRLGGLLRRLLEAVPHAVLHLLESIVHGLRQSFRRLLNSLRGRCRRGSLLLGERSQLSGQCLLRGDQLLNAPIGFAVVLITAAQHRPGDNRCPDEDGHSQNDQCDFHYECLSLSWIQLWPSA